jgi:hypothetical protein
MTDGTQSAAQATLSLIPLVVGYGITKAILKDTKSKSHKKRKTQKRLKR